MNQEVKGGQVWVGKHTGIEYTVVAVGPEYADLEWYEDNKKKMSPERIYLITNSGSYALKKHTATSSENAHSEMSALRDHFAGLAMNHLVSEWPDGMKDEMAKHAYRIADAMLEARGK